ncbi:MAG: hypothetical protein ACE37E_12705 [Hyphomicrobiales bacterium]
MVKRSTPARRKRRKPAARPSNTRSREPEAAAIDALFDAFAHNLARKLAARSARASKPKTPSGESR